MEMVTFMVLSVCTGLIAASTRPSLATVVFNLTKVGLENVLRPLATTLSKTQDTFKGSLRSGNGRSALNIFSTTGGRLPYNVFGSAEGGGTLDFFGRIISNIRPYLDPLRIITSKSSGNSSALVWSTSEEQR